MSFEQFTRAEAEVRQLASYLRWVRAFAAISFPGTRAHTELHERKARLQRELAEAERRRDEAVG